MIGEFFGYVLCIFAGVVIGLLIAGLISDYHDGL